MKEQELLHLAALLHDIGKFRMRHKQPNKRHQEHSYQFVTEDFADFFSPCGEIFKNAIRHHHPERYPEVRPNQLESMIEKQVILADRLSAAEREDEEREREYFGRSALVSIMSRLKKADKEYRYDLNPLNLERDTIMPAEAAEVDQDAYTRLWTAFTSDFQKLADRGNYAPAVYQSVVALIHRYTSRMPSATPWGASEKKAVPDVSLYDHLRTTAAIAACIGRELDETEVDAHLRRLKQRANQKICTLIKGDISGIQNFLYQIVSKGASNQLRGRSFYLQLLTEAIAHWVLRQFDLPITNLLLASGGHFYILAPYSEAKEKLDKLRQTLSQKLWKLHNGDLSCILADTSIKAGDFEANNFSRKWGDVSEKVQQRKQRKWAEMGTQAMFENFFEPHSNTQSDWGFEELGKALRNPDYLVAFEVPESPIPEKPNWHAAIKAFGLDIRLCPNTDEKPTAPKQAERAIVYRLGETDFLTDQVLETFQWEDLPVSYDFRLLPQMIAHRHDTSDPEKIADYDYLANASEGVQWLGALRMDVDDLGTVFTKEKLDSATISRLATLSESLRLFFEGYVPELCRKYNEKQKQQILELIYAGGDDLFLVGGWSALPEIAEQIRSEFREFVTGDHVTLSGGIVVEHMKYPLYQFAAQSGEAEQKAKRLHRLSSDGKMKKKDAITFLQKSMAWTDFENMAEWHQRLLDAVNAERDAIPHGVLTRLSHIYADEKRWAWRSLYYFNQLEEQYKPQKQLLRELKHELNLVELRKFIHIITRWTALRIRNKED